MSNRIGSICNELAKRLQVEPTDALAMFYRSKTCASLHDRNSDLYLLSDLYVADEFMIEMGMF